MPDDVTSIFTALSEESSKHLRRWANAQFKQVTHHGQCRSIALSAAAWRALRFGQEEGLLDFLGKNLAVIASRLPPARALDLLRTAFIRAALEDESDTIEFLSTIPEIETTIAWVDFWTHSSSDAVVTELSKPALTGHELHSARALAARRHPQLITASWLHELNPDLVPWVAGRCLAESALLHRPDLTADALRILEDPRFLFTAFSGHCATKLLNGRPESADDIAHALGFGYNERALVEQAKAHLQQNQAHQALNYLEDIRPLSNAYAYGQLLRVRIFCDLADPAALNILKLIEHPLFRRQALMCCREVFPDRIAIDEVIAAANACTAREPEVFYKLVTLILQAGHLDTAKTICGSKQQVFESNEIVSSIIRVIIPK